MAGQEENRMGVGCIQLGTLASGALATSSITLGALHVFSTPTSGGCTLALPDGEHEGQKTIFKMETDGTTNLVITPASFMDGTTITFADANDAAELMWDGGEWVVVSLNGAAVA